MPFDLSSELFDDVPDFDLSDACVDDYQSLQGESDLASATRMQNGIAR